MRLGFLGTGSGTEPIFGYHHSSLVIEHNDSVYWFDAGESCSYTAHLGGVDLLATRAIFISHTHMDHVGGLPNLLWTLRKLNGLAQDKHKRLTGNTIRVFIPDLSVWAGVRSLLEGTEGNYEIDFSLTATSFGDGLIYDEDGFRVVALHNHHLGQPMEGSSWKTYSFRIQTANASLVYSGDVASITDIEPLIDKADVLLMETGHHRVEDICHWLKASGKKFERLGLTHHGRAVIADPEGELNKAKNILGERVFLAREHEWLELP